MQAALEWGAPMFSKRGGDHDYMMRSEKRPGQRPQGAPPPRRKRRRRMEKHPFYAALTVLALLIAYPIGLIMLWVRKLRWSAVSKLLLSIVTGILFFLLAAYALTMQVDNPYVTHAQDVVKEKLAVVSEAVGHTLTDRAQIEYNLTVNGPRMLYAAAGGLYEGTIKGIGQIQDNVLTFLAKSDGMADTLVKLTGERGLKALYDTGVVPTPEAIPTTDPAILPTQSPDGGQTPAVTPEETENVAPKASQMAAWPPETAQSPKLDSAATQPPEGTANPAAVEPSAATGKGVKTPETAQPTGAASVQAQTAKPAEARAPLGDPATTPPEAAQASAALGQPETPDATTAPTLEPSPTATPVPTPSPTPIVLPKAQDAGSATVYFFDSSKYYHATSSCSNMHNAPARTLQEASDRGKLYCNRCKPPELSLLDADLVVWRGDDNVFHISSECAALTSTFALKPFEVAWIEDGLVGCPLCGSDLYVEARRMSVEPTPVPAPAMPLE